MDVCTNPDVLRAIYFCISLINVVRIIIPIGLIIMGTVDLSKAIIASEEKNQKGVINLFIKRIIYAALVFAVPLIVYLSMTFIDDVTDKDDYLDCITNANKDDIARYSEKES